MLPYLSLNSHFLLTLQENVAVTNYACQVNYNSIGQYFTTFSSDPWGKPSTSTSNNKRPVSYRTAAVTSCPMNPSGETVSHSAQEILHA
jgi:hypothetical protein